MLCSSALLLLTNALVRPDATDAPAVPPVAAPWLELAVAGALIVLLPLGLILYGRLLWRTLTGKGQVSVARLGWPEAGIAFSLAALFIVLMSTVGFQSQGPVSDPDSRSIVFGVALDTIFKVVLVGGLLIALGSRGINPAESFGFSRMGMGRVLPLAAGMLLAALPLVYGMIWLTQHATGTGGTEQPKEEAVRLFFASRDLAPKLAMIVAAVIVAPIVEELLFRGYLYGVIRRFFGAGAGLALNAGLFAGIHLHIPSLGGLFTLAVCLTLAYEATGSILVPMTMHALFNSLSVALMILGVAGS